MFPIFMFMIHSLWFRNPRTVRISILSSTTFYPSSYLSTPSISFSSSSSYSINIPLSLLFFFIIAVDKTALLSLLLSISCYIAESAPFPLANSNAFSPLPFVPANLLPSSFKIGSSLRAVRSTIEIDSSRMLKGMSLTGDFYWLIYRWRSLWFISL